MSEKTGAGFMASLFSGWKTIAVSALLVIVSLLDLFDMIDLRSLLLLAGVPEGKVGGALAIVSLLFAFLRYLTTTPMFVRLREGDVLVPVPEPLAAEVKAAVAVVAAEQATPVPV